MPPDIEITQQQEKAIRKYVTRNNGKLEAVIGNNFFKADAWRWNLNGKQLRIYTSMDPAHYGSRRLDCSDKHAQDLEASGIVYFSQTPEQQK